MPKNTFKPSCSLSKNYKRQRGNINIKTNSTRYDKHEKCTQYYSPPCNIDTPENSPVVTPKITSVQHFDVDTNLSSIFQDGKEYNCTSTRQISTDLPSFRSQLASFVVSSQISKTSTNKLLKLLKSVKNLESL